MRDFKARKKDSNPMNVTPSYWRYSSAGVIRSNSSSSLEINTFAAAQYIQYK